MNFKSLLIITYGRSGSTLLQGLLNAIDHCTIRGENYSFCYGLFQAYQALQKTLQEDCVQKQKVASPTSPFFGGDLLDTQQFIKDAKSMVRHQLAPADDTSTCYGFKEIRHLLPDIPPDDLIAYLDFLALIFPKPAFIILTRNHQQVINSAWWKSMKPENVTYRLELFEAKISQQNTNPATTFYLDYQDMTQQTPQLQAMYQFLGVPYDPETIQKVLATPHSYSPQKGTIIPYADTQNDLPQEVLRFFIDEDVESKVNKLFTLRGVLALKDDQQSHYKLIAKDLAGEHEVEWGLPSPWLAQQYPDSKELKYARFKINKMCITAYCPLDLYLVAPDGTRQKLAQVEAD